MNPEDDFMEIGNTGMVPTGKDLLWDKHTKEFVDPHEGDEDAKEEEED